MLGQPAPPCLIWSGAAGIGEHCLHMDQGTKRGKLNMQVQADRPRGGRLTLLLCSRPVTTEREHHHLQG